MAWASMLLHTQASSTRRCSCQCVVPFAQRLNQLCDLSADTSFTPAGASSTKLLEQCLCHPTRPPPRLSSSSGWPGPHRTTCRTTLSHSFAPQRHCANVGHVSSNNTWDRDDLDEGLAVGICRLFFFIVKAEMLERFWTTGGNRPLSLTQISARMSEMLAKNVPREITNLLFPS